MKTFKDPVLYVFGLSLFLAVFLFGYAGRDDAHITYFVSDMVAQGKGVVNYNGDRIEQSSSYLFATLLGWFVYLTNSKAADVGPFFSALWLIVSAAYIVRQCVLRQAGLLPIMVLASTPIVYWAISGMENSFYFFLILLLIFNLDDFFARSDDARGIGWLARLVGMAMLTFALALTRPEFSFVLVAALILFSLLSLRQYSEAMPIVAVLLLGVLAAYAYRLSVGLQLFPNPVYAKSGNSDRMADLVKGFGYLLRNLTETPFSMGLGIVGLLVAIYFIRSGKVGVFHSSSYKFMVSLILTGGAFAVFGGGDWMEAGRYLTIPVGVSVLILMFALTRQSRWLSILSLGVVFLSFAYEYRELAGQRYGGAPTFVPYDVVDTEQYKPSWLEKFNVIHARDISFVEELLASIDDDPDRDRKIVIASVQAGMVPYYLFHERKDQFYFIDLAGLATSHILDCRPDVKQDYVPYADSVGMQDCIGIKYDYVFDLDFRNWPRIEALEKVGCTEVFRQELVFKAGVSWKKPFPTKQFLMKCN